MNARDRITESKLSAAVELLRGVGFSIVAPEWLRLQVLSVSDAAEVLGESPAKVRDYAKRGLFPGSYSTEGGDLRIPQTAIEAYQQRLAADFAAAHAIPLPVGRRAA